MLTHRRKDYVNRVRDQGNLLGQKNVAQSLSDSSHRSWESFDTTLPLHCWNPAHLCPMEVLVPRNPLFTGMAVSTADKLKCSNQDVLRQGRKGARENMEMLKN